MTTTETKAREAKLSDFLLAPLSGEPDGLRVHMASVTVTKAKAEARVQAEKAGESYGVYKLISKAKIVARATSERA